MLTLKDADKSHITAWPLAETALIAGSLGVPWWKDGVRDKAAGKIIKQLMKANLSSRGNQSRSSVKKAKRSTLQKAGLSQGSRLEGS